MVDESYVRTATSPLVGGGPPEFCEYGLLWWVAAGVEPEHFFAAGHGGQYVVVVPALDLVVVTVADAGAVARPQGWPLRRLVLETVVPGFAGAYAGRS